MGEMNHDVTDLRHYVSYPVCGFCMNAWDMIYGRKRTGTNCEKWLGFCKWGGCDPDVWEYLDERTGWPWGWKINPKTMTPRVFETLMEIPIPDYDNRVYHMRRSDDPGAPWRKTSERLRAARLAKNGKVKGINLEDVEWDGEITDEDLTGVSGFPGHEPDAVDLDDPDLWS